MALYIPAGRRRRRLIVAVAVAAVVGLLAGWAIGRAGAPSIDDRASSVRSGAQRVDARLLALPIEYEKVLAGDPQYANGGGPADSLTGIVADTQRLASDAVWLSDGQRAAVVAAVDRARTTAIDRADASAFAAAVDQATSSVETTFGLESGGAP